MIEFTNYTSGELYTQICGASAEGAYVSYLRGKRCKNDTATLWELSASFQFPGYFGENWNAANDCLTDLEWLNLKALFVVVEDYSRVGTPMLSKFLRIMGEYWESEGVPIRILLNG